MATLSYKVECRKTTGGGGSYYDVIAAFDCQEAAEAYAGECALANMALHYRVKKGKLLLRQFGPNE